MATDLNQNRATKTLRPVAVSASASSQMARRSTLGLMLPGCTKANLRGDAFAQDEWSTLPQSFRRADQPGSASAYSNKARQIERNLGVP